MRVHPGGCVHWRDVGDGRSDRLLASEWRQSMIKNNTSKCERRASDAASIKIGFKKQGCFISNARLLKRHVRELGIACRMKPLMLIIFDTFQAPYLFPLVDKSTSWKAPC